MRFGKIPIDHAEGAILAHAVQLPSVHLKKGRVLSASDLVLLKLSNVVEVIAARLEANDVPEDVAAKRVADAACGLHTTALDAFTGRANLYTAATGLVVLDDVRVRAVNHVHESLTIATLPPFARVKAGDMVATIKVIPFAIPAPVLQSVLQILTEGPLVNVSPFTEKRVGLIVTRLAQTKEALVAKSEFSMRNRVEALGGNVTHLAVCDHTTNAIRDEIQRLSVDIILIFGAAAIVDRGDVIPMALEAAGGTVQHLGMPVDPGNLLMLGNLGKVPVIGVPSCARSPKMNGFDWVLSRFMAGIPVSPLDIMDMGVGGLLAEIPTRPSPREPILALKQKLHVNALVLAAGSSTRMGANKLLAELNGVHLIVKTVARIARSQVEKITVVVGHDAAAVMLALRDQPVTFIENPDFIEGLATSLKAGVSALQNSSDAILVCLGDMPLIDPDDINSMIAVFNPSGHGSIVVPVHERAYGNPVMWGAAHFPALMTCEGDRGARGLLENLKDDIMELAIDHPGVVLDADTPEALATIRSIARL